MGIDVQVNVTYSTTLEVPLKVLVSKIRMKIRPFINLTMAVFGLLVIIFTENSNAGSYYPKFKKTRPSLIRFKNGFSRTNPNYTPYANREEWSSLTENIIHTTVFLIS